MTEAGKCSRCVFHFLVPTRVPYVRLPVWPTPNNRHMGQIQDAIWTSIRPTPS